MGLTQVRSGKLRRQLLLLPTKMRCILLQLRRRLSNLGLGHVTYCWLLLLWLWLPEDRSMSNLWRWLRKAGGRLGEIKGWLWHVGGNLSQCLSQLRLALC